MTTPINDWLRAAEAAFGDDHASDVQIDALLQEGIAIDADQSVLADPVRLQRVLAVLQARRAAVVTEMNDMTRRRAALLQAQAAATGYLNATDSVPMR
jgi:hypothetical protein